VQRHQWETPKEIWVFLLSLILEALQSRINSILRPQLAVSIFPPQAQLKLLSTTNHTLYQ